MKETTKDLIKNLKVHANLQLPHLGQDCGIGEELKDKMTNPNWPNKPLKND